MTATIHQLPEPVPEGWVASRFSTGGVAYAWTRSAMEVTFYESEGYYRVFPAFDCFVTLSEACAAAERAFCGCYVRKS